jgi:hypothetical protein
MLRPEEQLLLLTGSVAADGPRRAALESLLGAPIDWDRLIPQALAHGTAPLLAAHLSGAARVPAPVRARLAAIERMSWGHVTLLAEHWREVVHLLAERRIPNLTLKGMALAHTVYPRLGLRPMADIDVLVHPGDAGRVADALRAAGFATPGGVLDDANRFRSFMLFRRGETLVDLRWQLATWARFDGILRIDHETFWARARPLPVAGVEALAPSPECLLLYLVLHLTLGSEFGRLIWVTDLDALIRATPALDWRAVLAGAERWRIRVILGYALGVAITAFDTPIPADVRAALRVGRLRQAVLARCADAPWPAGVRAPVGEVRVYVGETVLMDRACDVARVIARSIVPSAGWVRLHYGLRGRWQVALYRLLHPLRVCYLALARLR